ncbi:hypothetical protein [Micromonospora sp. DT31]|uniref:hypothetical protein n=1 Tax=Micromonospora sp. DT31 TaxID=3393434 RepID=UPI003CF40F40
MAGPAAADGVINGNPAFIQFYVNNVENLSRVDDVCPGDWQDLVYYMKRYQLSPDIYLVQQISGQTQINALAKRMTDELKGTYVGIAAVANPTVTNNGCDKPQQTTGIIYRPGRFEVVNQGRWRANRLDGSCINETKDRSAHLGIRFRDTIANKYVSVSTVHFPVKSTGGNACIDHNITESGAETAELGATNLSVWGGDLNISDRDGSTFRSWYNKVNGDRGGALGWRDAIYHACNKANPATVAACAAANGTLGNSANRYDYLFSKLPGGAKPRIENAKTISFDEGDAADNYYTNSDREDRNYSDHRAVQARIFYTAG